MSDFEGSPKEDYIGRAAERAQEARIRAEGHLVGEQVLSLLKDTIDASTNELSAGFLIIKVTDLRQKVLPENDKARVSDIASALGESAALAGEVAAREARAAIAAEESIQAAERFLVD